MKKLSIEKLLVMVIISVTMFVVAFTVLVNHVEARNIQREIREIEAQIAHEKELAKIKRIGKETERFTDVMNNQYHAVIAKDLKDVTLEEINNVILGFEKLADSYLADEVIEVKEQYINELKELVATKEELIEVEKEEAKLAKQRAEKEAAEKAEKEKMSNTPSNKVNNSSKTTSKTSNKNNNIKNDPFDAMPAELKKGLKGIKIDSSINASGRFSVADYTITFKNQAMRMNWWVAFHETGHLYGTRTGYDSTKEWIDIYNAEWKGKGVYGSSHRKEAFAETVAKVFGATGNTMTKLPAKTPRSEQYVKELFGLAKPSAPQKEYTKEEIADMKGMAERGKKATTSYNVFEHHGSTTIIGSIKNGQSFYTTGKSMTQIGVGFTCTYEGIKVPGGVRGVILTKTTGDASQCAK